VEQTDPKVRRQRRSWRQRIKDIDPKRFIFLDQTNAKTTFTRVYGRAKRGNRVTEYVPDGRWESLTLMGTLGYLGETTAFTYEGGTDQMVMRTFSEKILAPQLGPQHIVVMDRFASHWDAPMIKTLRSTRARIWHLPPYSHDYNPIENMWSKVKAHLRKTKPREVDALIAKIGDALQLITPQDAQGWFAHCGYGTRKDKANT